MEPRKKKLSQLNESMDPDALFQRDVMRRVSEAEKTGRFRCGLKLKGYPKK